MSQALRKRPSKAARYETDTYGWAVEQAAALRAGRIADLDLTNLAEEIDDLGKAEFSRMESALRLILLHMLKWDYQRERRSRSWTITVEIQRLEYEKTLRKNPGLKHRRDEALADAYGTARLEAASETGLPKSTFPPDNPYSLEHVLTRPIEWPET